MKKSWVIQALAVGAMALTTAIAIPAAYAGTVRTNPAPTPSPGSPTPLPPPPPPPVVVVPPSTTPPPPTYVDPTYGCGNSTSVSLC